jgi:hypothetical protein
LALVLALESPCEVLLSDRVSDGAREEERELPPPPRWRRAGVEVELEAGTELFAGRWDRACVRGDHSASDTSLPELTLPSMDAYARSFPLEVEAEAGTGVCALLCAYVRSCGGPESDMEDEGVRIGTAEASRVPCGCGCRWCGERGWGECTDALS